MLFKKLLSDLPVRRKGIWQGEKMHEYTSGIFGDQVLSQGLRASSPLRKDAAGRV